MSRLLKLLWEAQSSLRSYKLRSFLMMLSVIIGIASLATVICIGQGTREEIVGLIAKHGLDMIMVRAGGVRQVFAPTTDRSIASLSEADAQAMEASIGNIVKISPVQNARGWRTSYGGKTLQPRVFGVGPTWADIRRRPIAQGEFINQSDVVSLAKVAVLGHNTAKMLFGDADPIGQTIRIGNDGFRVKGVFVEVGADPSGEDWDDRIVLPFSTTAKRLFGRPYLEQIVIQVRDVRRLPETAEQVGILLRERHNIRASADDDFFVRIPEDVKEAALETSTTLNKLLIAISSVALLVGGVVIMNIMLISVSQRTHEIGLRRAVGASRGDIITQFLLESLCVAVAAGLLGGLLGAGIASALGWKGVATSKVTWLPFALSVVSCGLLAIVFGLYPARKAALVDPVVALREKRI